MTEITTRYLLPTFLVGILTAILMLSLRLAIFRYVEQQYLKKNQHIVHREVKEISFVDYWYSDEFKYLTKVKMPVRYLDLLIPGIILGILGFEFSYILIGILVHYTILNFLIILVSRYIFHIKKFWWFVVETIIETIIIYIVTGLLYFYEMRRGS